GRSDIMLYHVAGNWSSVSRYLTVSIATPPDRVKTKSPPSPIQGREVKCPRGATLVRWTRASPAHSPGTGRLVATDALRPGNGGVSGGYYLPEQRTTNREQNVVMQICSLFFVFVLTCLLRDSQAHSIPVLAPASHQAAGSLGGDGVCTLPDRRRWLFDC